MATIKNRSKFLTHYFGATVPYGNQTVLTYEVITNNTGVLTPSDSNTPIAIGDVIDVGVLPEGFCMTDATVFVMEGMTALTTAKVGFVYADGKDHDKVPQDAEYFVKSGADLATAGRIRANGNKLVVLPKEARLILTIAGAANAKKSHLRIAVSGELVGAE